MEILTRFLGGGSRKGEATLLFQIINKTKNSFKWDFFPDFSTWLHLIPIQTVAAFTS